MPAKRLRRDGRWPRAHLGFFVHGYMGARLDHHKSPFHRLRHVNARLLREASGLRAGGGGTKRGHQQIKHFLPGELVNRGRCHAMPCHAMSCHAMPRHASHLRRDSWVVVAGDDHGRALPNVESVLQQLLPGLHLSLFGVHTGSMDPVASREHHATKAGNRIKSGEVLRCGFR